MRPDWPKGCSGKEQSRRVLKIPRCLVLRTVGTLGIEGRSWKGRDALLGVQQASHSSFSRRNCRGELALHPVVSGNSDRPCFTLHRDRSSATARPASDGSAPRGRTTERNTPKHEELVVRYPWHPLYGSKVFIRKSVTKDGLPRYRCGLPNQENCSGFEMPQWMFDSVLCSSMRVREDPLVDCFALQELEALLSRFTCRSVVSQQVQGHHCAKNSNKETAHEKISEPSPSPIPTEPIRSEDQCSPPRPSSREDPPRTPSTPGSTIQELPSIGPDC